MTEKSNVALLLCSQALFLVAFHGKSSRDSCIRHPKIDAGLERKGRYTG